MKRIMILLVLLQSMTMSNAQINFENQTDFKFSFTEYLCISSEINLDTIINNEFETRIWITRPNNLSRNLLRFFMPQDDSLIHAQLFVMEVDKNIQCVNTIEELIIPDFLLDSINIATILKNVTELRGDDTLYCVGIDSKQALKFLKKNNLIKKEIMNIDEVDPEKLESLPHKFYEDCEKSNYNYKIKRNNGFDYTIELLKKDAKRGIFYQSPDKYPEIIISNHTDLKRINNIINEIEKLFRMLNFNIISN